MCVCSVSGVAFSFNGGKDSTVLLHIIRAAVVLPLPERTADLQSKDHGEIIVLSFHINCKNELPIKVQAITSQNMPIKTLTICCAGLKGICSFVFERQDDFSEILAFTNDMSKQYDLNVHTLHADFRSGVEGMLETTELKAIILGTRR